MTNKLFTLLFVFLLLSCGNNNRRHGNVEGNNKNESDNTTSVDNKVSDPQRNKKTVNVYIENSGSMDGYVRGVTEFEQSVYNYLSDIKNADVADCLNLYYINSEMIDFAVNVDADVISDFIEKLEPYDFKIRGGNRGTSDLAMIIRDILTQTDSNHISILVTDGIFSPGKGKNASEYLVNQEIGIKNNLAKQLKNYPDFAVVVYQLSSKFNGTYYNKIDSPIHLDNKQRPFYIWLFGQAEDLSNLCEEVPDGNFRGSGVLKKFSIVAGGRDVDYAVKNQSGKFKLSRKAHKTEIEDLKADRDGKVRFSVNVDFSSLLLDDDYLADVSNYDVHGWDLSVKKNTSTAKYTHTITLTTQKSKQKNGLLSIKLRMAKPDWDDVNDSEGERPIEGKTYGIKQQIDGVYGAFTNKNKYYTELLINIK